MAETPQEKSESKEAPAADGVELSDLDKMLAESDPEFLKSLGTLEAGLKEDLQNSRVAGATAPVSSVPIPTSMAVPDLEIPPVVKQSLFNRLLRWRPSKGGATKGISGLKQIPVWAKAKVAGLKKASDPKVLTAELKKRVNVQTLKTIPGKLQKAGNEVKNSLMGFVRRLGALSLNKKLLLGSAIFLAVGIPLGLPYLSKFFRLKSDEIIGNYTPVADLKKTFGADEEIVTFGEVDTLSNFVVLLPKIVINIRRSANSTSNPMAAMELYLEGSNQAAAVEIQDREREMKDLAQRVAEELTYDDWASQQGKQKYKLFLRKEVNRVLNKGRLKAVYFKTIFIKP